MNSLLQGQLRTVSSREHYPLIYMYHQAGEGFVYVITLWLLSETHALCIRHNSQLWPQRDCSQINASLLQSWTILVKKSERGLPKTIISYSSPRISTSSFSLPPLPLYNVDLGNADCRETVRDPPNNIELGGGGRGKYGRSIVHLSKRLEGYVFLTVLSTIVSANFFPFPQNSKSLNFPGAVDRHTGRCSLSYAYVNVSVLFSRDVTSQK